MEEYKFSISVLIKKYIASIGWRLFIWGNSYTEEEYWEQIYEQEKAFKEPNIEED